MWEKIEDDSRGHAHFLAEQEGFVKVVKVIPVRNDDQFVDASLLKKRAYLLRGYDSNQLEAPIQMGFNAFTKISCGSPISGDCDMTDIESTVFFQFQEQDAV